ncbi:sodium:proton antiporter [Treponema sp. OMZ 788]|uniref:SLC13 family permease n=1 Tax=Treponema sp. OMZ 788 TaxID=2563664 RepID=UPI0020A29D02|nr:Na+/H+ antiporter NhaC family protein [Treponema sp. OMZ 788]UTC63638.1 sodium:proton antiporter [Treponema sp. OMZ 788]
MINPLILSVVVMTVLCLLHVNLLVSIVLAAILGGFVGGLGLSGTMEAMVLGMGDNSEIVLSYVLLGLIAAAINETHLVDFVAVKAYKNLRGKKFLLLFLLTFVGIISETVAPIHVSWIPLVVPFLLVIMNSMKLDRRAVACSLTFSLKWPYLIFPIGFGLVFHTIIARAMAQNGLEFQIKDVWKSMLVPGMAMVVGWLISVFVSYRKPREYEQDGFEFDMEYEVKFGRKEWAAAISIVVLAVVQIITKSMAWGCIASITVLLGTATADIRKSNERMNYSMRIMGAIAFIMLVAGGFSKIMVATGSIDSLVSHTASLFGTNKLAAAFFMLLIGLLITMGIGTSFGSVPIIATLYVPLGIKLGFSPAAIACLVGTAAALGDAGSPSSDVTLGPTSGLITDRQHNHIWDTCVPTFLHFNIPLLIGGVIGALIL